MDDKSMKLKVRLYSLFQFISFFAIIFLTLSFGLFLYGLFKENNSMNFEFVKSEAKFIFTFKYTKSTSLISSFLLYSSFILFFTSWIIGWFTLITANRNYYDQLFLMFLLLPIAANIFCLIAQLSLKVFMYKSTRLSQKDLKLATKKLIKKIDKLK